MNAFKFIPLLICFIFNLNSYAGESRFSYYRLMSPNDAIKEIVSPSSLKSLSSVSIKSLGSSLVLINGRYYKISGNGGSAYYNVSYGTFGGGFRLGISSSGSYYLFYSNGSSAGVAYCSFYEGRPNFCYEEKSNYKQQEVFFGEIKSYYLTLLEKTCPANTHLNTQTNECVSCSSGQSYDYDNNRCYNDCTDKNLNKWGFVDGTCIDCSSALDISSCYCTGIGSSSSGVVLMNSSDLSIPKGFAYSSCVNGSGFYYKLKIDPNKDKEEEKDKETPTDSPSSLNTPNNNQESPNNNSGSAGSNLGNSGGSSGAGVGGFKPNTNSNTDPSNTATDKDKQPNDANDKDKGNDSDIDTTNPNGSNITINNNTIISGSNPNSNAKESEQDGEGLDYGSLSSANDSFLKDYTSAFNEISSKFDNFLVSLDQFKDNLSLNHKSSFEKGGAVNSCILSKNISIYGRYNADLKLDICAFTYTLRLFLYPVFYALFVWLFLLAFIKLFIFSF